MQIPVLNGVYADDSADFRASYPVNMQPVALQQGISAGYLRPAEGLVQLGAGPGVDRGGIAWKDFCYRVMGSQFVRIESDGSLTSLGSVGLGTGKVSFSFSFDRLAIAAEGALWYWDGTTLSQVADPDLGTVLDVEWIDGYFMTTDGTSLVVTDLTDPFQVNPLKYGSSEQSPDSIVAVLQLHGEAVAVNTTTIEFFENIGGSLFPFQRIKGALISRGAAGTHACCTFGGAAIAFLGGGKNEAPSIYFGANASSTPIATREIARLLEAYTPAQLSEAVLEERLYRGAHLLYVHLPDRTLVYDHIASQAVQEPVWFVLTSSLLGWERYRARDLVFCYGKWIFGDPTSSSYGYLDLKTSHHLGSIVRWEFGTLILYNEGRMAIVHELELVCLTGSVAAGLDPQLSTSWSSDGELWSQSHFIPAGKQGERAKRITWLQQGLLGGEGSALRIQRFRGDSQAFLSIARLEARLEALNA